MDGGMIAAMKRHFVRTARGVCPRYRVTDEQRAVTNDIFRWCLMLPGRLDWRRGLWLHGDIGCGKTTMLHIVKCFCRDVRPAGPDGTRYSFRISNAVDVCAGFSQRGYRALATYLESRRQAFDELGSESSPTGYYGTAENVFQYILQRRYDKWGEHSFTHVTTNLTPGQIAERYGERVFDRCREMFNLVEMSGVSFRGDAAVI